MTANAGARAALGDALALGARWAALLSPRLPALLVLNEPEASLQADLLPALARLIARTARHTRVWVLTRAMRLVAALEACERCNSIALEKAHGQTTVAGLSALDRPTWRWPE